MGKDAGQPSRRYRAETTFPGPSHSPFRSCWYNVGDSRDWLYCRLYLHRTLDTVMAGQPRSVGSVTMGCVQQYVIRTTRLTEQNADPRTSKDLKNDAVRTPSGQRDMGDDAYETRPSRLHIMCLTLVSVTQTVAAGRRDSVTYQLKAFMAEHVPFRPCLALDGAVRFCAI